MLAQLEADDPSVARTDLMTNRPATHLVAATAEHFDWAIQGTESAFSVDGLRLPPGGLDSPTVLAWVKRTSLAVVEATRQPAGWLIASGDEVVGLISFLGPPSAGAVEIGYGVAASRRDRGHATRAVALAVAHAAAQGLDVLAATSTENRPSEIVLERNGFQRCGERSDPSDGRLVLWRRGRGAFRRVRGVERNAGEGTEKSSRRNAMERRAGGSA